MCSPLEPAETHRFTTSTLPERRHLHFAEIAAASGQTWQDLFLEVSGQRLSRGPNTAFGLSAVSSRAGLTDSRQPSRSRCMSTNHSLAAPWTDCCGSKALGLASRKPETSRKQQSVHTESSTRNEAAPLKPITSRCAHSDKYSWKSLWDNSVACLQKVADRLNGDQLKKQPLHKSSYFRKLHRMRFGRRKRVDTWRLGCAGAALNCKW